MAQEKKEKTKISVAIELWNDSKFILKRTEEQRQYIIDVCHKTNISIQRKTELIDSADYIYNRFYHRWLELNDINLEKYYENREITIKNWKNMGLIS